MTDHSTSAIVARAFTEAWTSHDVDTAGSYLTDDVVFDGPLGHVNGKRSYLESLNGLTQALGVTGAHIVAAFGDESQALIMYELNTSQFGTLTCAKLLIMRDGKIRSDRLTFDSYEIRKAQGR